MSCKLDLEKIFRAGLGAVAPDQALGRRLKLVEGALYVDDEPFWRLDQGNLHVVGAGKGAAPMAQALEAITGDHIKDGFVVVKYGHDLPTGKISIAQAAHPVPDEAGVEAAENILRIAGKCRRGDLLICLVTGGASALTPAPAKDISLADLAATNRLLLASGAGIQEVNAIRKHLSRLHGGQLARAANGARVLSLIVSDVIGDDLGVIASGPTAPDESSFVECLEIADKYRITARLPRNVLKRLLAGAAGEIPETPKPGDPVFENTRNVIIASNANALHASAAMARDLGYEPRMISSRMEGEARSAAVWFMDRARGVLKENALAPVCLLAGGETTVTLKGDGKGGRNQEMALAASCAIISEPRICALFAGTDGTDGPTDAAGGFAFCDTAAKIGGVEKAREFLANNDSYHALARAGDLFVSGPTRTNVMDMAIALTGDWKLS